MYFAAHWAMLLALLILIASAGFACLEAWSGQDNTTSWLERAHLLAALLSLAVIEAMPRRSASALPEMGCRQKQNVFSSDLGWLHK